MRTRISPRCDSQTLCLSGQNFDGEILRSWITGAIVFCFVDSSTAVTASAAFNEFVTVICGAYRSSPMSWRLGFTLTTTPLFFPVSVYQLDESSRRGSHATISRGKNKAVATRTCRPKA